ncbi:MAG: hypothetical protein RLZZ175_864 [Bacteroidota bacterium]|jgi:hypothetical protein
MLDFYLIRDDQVKPNFPESLGLVFVGSLDYITFEKLQNLGIISSQFDYYSDFRLDSIIIKQIRNNIIQKDLNFNSDIIKFTHLFDIADKNKSGLIAFGD